MYDYIIILIINNMFFSLQREYCVFELSKVVYCPSLFTLPTLLVALCVEHNPTGFLGPKP